MCLGCAFKIPISVYQSFFFSLGSVCLWGGCSSAVTAHQTWPPDSNLDVMLPLGTSLLWETTRVGDKTKKYHGARILLVGLGTSDPSNQVGDVTGHVKFVQHMTSLLGTGQLRRVSLGQATMHWCSKRQ